MPITFSTATKSLATAPQVGIAVELYVVAFASFTASTQTRCLRRPRGNDLLGTLAQQAGHASMHHLTINGRNAYSTRFASTSNITCAAPQPHLVGDPLFGSMAFRHLMILISEPCMAITISSTNYLSWTYLHRYTVPQEQRQILRIINLPAANSVFCFLGLLFYNDYFYIEPISAIYEAFSVAALFFLMLEFACPDGTDRVKYFEYLPALDKKGNVVAGGSLTWFKRTWASVLQYPLSKLVLVVIEIFTQCFHVYCENSFSPKYAHLWLTIIDLLFVGSALGPCIRLVQRLGKAKAFQANQAVRAKVWTFIGILIFQPLQGVIFGLLNGKLFGPSKKATYDDINFGIPAFLTCMETAIFSLIFMWAYRAKEYAEGRRLDRYGQAPATRTKTFKAIFDALNLHDILASTANAFKLLFTRVRSRYGSRTTSQREKLMQDGVGMEPLPQRNGTRGYNGESEFNDDQYSPPASEYDNRGTSYAPAMPLSARDTSPPGRTRNLRADGLGPHEYQPLTRSRNPSPSGGREQYPRTMV
ncbi:hypothetical protein LTR62_002806 [Meristemomyces frigidus]|uniref:Transmembrane protein n=1 Tax=Meristemomyces frigidus TaxID=1508187 RepID=A0AAN7TXN7_9PEZI|nr:hypothetical protein LTR62_002806 [Meristemomyces frigidus]